MPPFHTVSLWDPKDGALFLRGGLAVGFYRSLTWFTYPPAGAPGRPLTGGPARLVYSVRVQHVSNILERMVKLRID